MGRRVEITETEMQVLECLASRWKGKPWSLEDIALELEKEPATIRQHIQNLKAKLGIAKQASLIERAPFILATASQDGA